MQSSAYHPQFITATILNWKQLLGPDIYKDIIIESLRFLVVNNRVKVFAFVIMPNHLHLIWQILVNQKREDVQRDFLKYTAQKIRFDMQVNHPQWLKEFEVKSKDRRYQFWERNALSIDLYSEPVFIQKINYLHYNPTQIKWQLCSKPEEYFYSSAFFYETGIDNWGFLTHFRS